MHYMHGITFVCSLIALYIVLSPFLSTRELTQKESNTFLDTDSAPLYAQELQELSLSRESGLITEEEYQEQKNLLLYDARNIR